MDSNNKSFVYLTKDRLHELETELNSLKLKGRKDIAEKMSQTSGSHLHY